jgi:hypothetical protein
MMYQSAANSSKQATSAMVTRLNVMRCRNVDCATFPTYPGGRISATTMGAAGSSAASNGAASSLRNFA